MNAGVETGVAAPANRSREALLQRRAVVTRRLAKLNAHLSVSRRDFQCLFTPAEQTRWCGVATLLLVP